MTKQAPPKEPSSPHCEWNGVGMTLVYVPAGTFTMGSGPGEDFRGNDERMHRVRISRPFFIGVHEVTVGQFEQFVEESGYRTESERSEVGARGCMLESPPGEYGRQYSWQNPGFEQGAQHPVTCVSWSDAIEFCRWLSQRERRRYRLPTEAEWEYACRAGSDGAFSVPEIAPLWPDANLNHSLLRLGDGVERPRDGFNSSAPVGSFPPNAFGLYDMHGNVAEWCADWYRPDYPRLGGSLDPTGSSEGKERVTRGGGFLDCGPYARSANRISYPPDAAVSDLGFRVVREVTIR